jgi:broad specificity phosphatase PhoE
MEDKFPVVYLARHGETAWTVSGQHTGLTDLPLTDHGEITARRLGERLKNLTFEKVFTSPLQRTRRTCELAGFAFVAEIDADLVEWNYGKYEGRRGADIRRLAPVRTGSLVGFGQSPATYCSSPVGTSFVCWLPVGSGSNRPLTAGISC